MSVTEPVIDPGSAAAALQKALSALGHSSAYTSTNTHSTQSGYADPSELRPESDVGAGGSGTDSFYEAYIIRPTVVERSTIDSRACKGNSVSFKTLTKSETLMKTISHNSNIAQQHHFCTLHCVSKTGCSGQGLGG